MPRMAENSRNPAPALRSARRSLNPGRPSPAQDARDGQGNDPDVTHHCHRRPAQCRQVDAFQPPDRAAHRARLGHAGTDPRPPRGRGRYRRPPDADRRHGGARGSRCRLDRAADAGANGFSDRRGRRHRFRVRLPRWRDADRQGVRAHRSRFRAAGRARRQQMRGPRRHAKVSTRHTRSVLASRSRSPPSTARGSTNSKPSCCRRSG